VEVNTKPDFSVTPYQLMMGEIRRLYAAKYGNSTQLSDDEIWEYIDEFDHSLMYEPTDALLKVIRYEETKNEVLRERNPSCLTPPEKFDE
jgi:hypothetical protein